MSGKAHKRNRSIEEIEETAEESAVFSEAIAKLRSAAGAPLALLSAHRWKAVSVVAVAALGLSVGMGLLDVGKLTSWATAPGQQGEAETAAAGEQPAGAPATMVAAKPRPPSKPELKTCFTPVENCMGVIVAEIDSAQAEVLVQAYSLTAKPLIKALGRAHLRGVKVRVILDKADEQKSDRAGARLIAERILPQVDTGVASAHNKVMIIDRDAVITGSFNFTDAAQKKNAENVLLIKGHPDVVAAYAKNWEHRLKSSRPYYGTMAPVM